jgi:hypothetical protein
VSPFQCFGMKNAAINRHAHRLRLHTFALLMDQAGV